MYFWYFLSQSQSVNDDFCVYFPLPPQACRGARLDDGVEVDSAADTGAECIFPQYLSVPADTAVMYATASGKQQGLDTVLQLKAFYYHY